MKRLFLIILLCCPLPLLAASPDDPIPALFERYEAYQGTEYISISPMLIKMVSLADSDSKDILSKIHRMRVLIVSSSRVEQIRQDLKPILKTDYEELMKVKDDDNMVKVYGRLSQTNQQSALLVITDSESSCILLHLEGQVDQALIDAVMKGNISLY